MNGETATTGVADSAASTPGIASIGPMLVTGLEGRSRRALRGRLGRRRSAPRLPPLGTPRPRRRVPRRATQYSWKWIVSPASVWISVATGSSDIGRRSTSRSKASARVRIASVSVCPSSSRLVRVRWTARSRSPISMNSPTPRSAATGRSRGRPSAPYRRGIWGRSESDLRREPAEFLVGRRRVVRDPHHVSRSRTPPPANSTVSTSGQTRWPPSSISSPVLATTAISSGCHTGRPVEELRRPRAAGEKRDHTRARRRADLYPASAGDGAARVSNGVIYS